MYTIELFDVITTAAVLYIVALGLLIVYGVLKIINLAHGAFLALGSYAAVIATWLGWNPWSALIIALAVGVSRSSASSASEPKSKRTFIFSRDCRTRSGTQRSKLN